LQNYPVLTTATTSGNMTTISGTLNSTPNTPFRIEFFFNSACDPSGFGEGQFSIGSQNVTTDASGNATINFTPSFAVSAGQFITSTAADSSGNTSEFSNCRQVFAPTAASVSVGGRVTTASGRGISNVIVSAIDGSGNALTTTTNSFGYYSFAELRAGETYIFSVRAKLYRFAQPSRVLSVNDVQNNVNFTSIAQSKLRSM
jgi:hypothetical protein